MSASCQAGSNTACGGAVGPVVRRLEDPLQQPPGLGEVVAVRRRHGEPVIDLRLLVGLDADDEVEQPVRLVELGEVRAGEQQPAGAVEAQVEIDEAERLRVARQGVDVERAVDLPEAVAGDAVRRVQLQRPAEGEQRLAVLPAPGVAQPPEGVLQAIRDQLV